MGTSKVMLISVVQMILLLIPAGLSAGENEKLFQFGLFPPISSNGMDSGKTVNGISVNLIGGYSAGNRIFDLGGFWNASKEFTKGVQVAGILNYSGCSYNAAQIGGFANIAASGSSSLQLAGLLNVGDNVSGLQISALANVAKTVSGVQFGLINYMEDGEEGVSIGLINIAKYGGKYEFEVSFSESVNTAVSFRFGTDRFYTILSGGVSYFFSDIEYAVGLGFGTGVDWKRRWSNQIEIQAFGVSSGHKFTGSSAGSIIQLRLPVCKEFAKHFKIFAGPTINLGLQRSDASGNDRSALAPWTMWKAGWGNMLAAGWVGLSGGFRF